MSSISKRQDNFTTFNRRLKHAQFFRQNGWNCDVSNANINENGLNKGELHLNRLREDNGLITRTFCTFFKE